MKTEFLLYDDTKYLRLDCSAQPRALQGQPCHVAPQCLAQGPAQQTFSKCSICQLKRPAAHQARDLLITQSLDYLS